MLPAPAGDQAYCNVSALEAGIIKLPLPRFVKNADPDAVITAPSLSFLIQHSSRTEERFLFDLGIRKDWNNYPPVTIDTINRVFPVNVEKDVVDSLAAGGLHPQDITTCALSHVHWDHVGDTKPFSKCTFIVAADAKSLFQPGYPTDPNSGFPTDLLPADRTTFLSTESWTPVGPFPRGLDFYGDGSLYLIDAPGHLPGHLNVLARTSADGAWLLLAGDSAHHWSLLNGAGQISKGPPEWRSEHGCAHHDKEQAEAHLERLKRLLKEPRVRVMLAHDEPWFAQPGQSASFWPGKIPTL